MSAQEEDQPPPQVPAPVHDITEVRRDERLRDEFALVRETRPVYVLDTKEAAKRKGSAERMAKMRERQAQAGLKSTMVPTEVADEIKAAGGWKAWQETQAAATKNAPQVPPPKPEVQVVEKVVEKEVEKKIEVRVEVPAKITDLERQAMSIGRRVMKLGGLKGWIVRSLLGI